MPTNRKRVDRGRLDSLSTAQKSHLLSGDYILPFGDEFVDEQHRRHAWQVHGAEIMAAYDRDGHRPAAFWDYQVRGGWRRYGASEQDAVHKLLAAGKLDPCKPGELTKIEALWLHEVRVSLVHSGYRLLALTSPLSTWGTPTWFYQEHAPTILAELLAERERHRHLAGEPGGEVQ
jgi:hypothetical protein